MNVRARYLPGLLSALLLAGNVPASLAQDKALPNAGEGRPGVSAMLQEITPAVVNISVTGSVAVQQNPLLNDPRFREFFGFNMPDQPSRRQFQSAGSGVIIDAEKGYVLTNHHVVNEAEDIKITLLDKRVIDAELIGSDAGTDIALLQINASNLKAIPRSDSDTLRVGDFVAAIGNPFGIGQTVTSGIVSALDRSGIGPSEGYEDFIQTDASINPGNSGGPLVDYDGRLVGINSAIIAPAGGNVGIGFAVPINMAMSVVDQLLEFGEVRRGMLGVTIQDVTPDVVDALELSVSNGAIVSSVAPGSPAEEAGIQPGDIIIGVNKGSIVDSTDLRNTIGLIREGTEVEIELVREGSHRTVEATVGRAQSSPETAANAGAETSNVLTGATLGEIPQDHPSYGEVKGVLVAQVAPGSRAATNGLQAGDIITAVNRRPVTSASALQEAMGRSTGTLALNIVRDGNELFMIVR